MASIDLHQLANTGGFGAAKQHLAEAGAWDEYNGLPRRLFAVQVEYTVRETINVEARHPREAEDKARWSVVDNNASAADVDFDHVEVMDDRA